LAKRIYGFQLPRGGPADGEGGEGGGINVK
jgi:hypothetical protein